jgi:molybdenum cofactor cytidylyltransferase
MGKSKLSLEIQGKTLLEHALGPIREAGFKEVVVVFSEENEKLRALVPRDYHVVINRRSREGISTSLKAGVAAVDPRSQGILFALGDQPFVGVDVYQELVQYHRRHMTLLTWPVYKGKRGNPVLFDRRLWPELMKIEGDEGGKQIMACTAPEEIGQVEVAESGVLIDIDTPDEYEKYRR